MTRPRQLPETRAAVVGRRPLSPAAALASLGISPGKSKGQNFLVQARIAERIVAAAEIAPDDDVVEIGPGLGVLSERIAARPFHRLVLVELDDRLAARLAARFASDGRITVINRDFLTVDPAAYCAGAPLRIIANLPFSMASAILQRLCGLQAKIARMVLMFQREVAQRIRACAGSSDYGALSVFTGLYWEIAAYFRVAAGSFHPRPRVDAEVLTFVPRTAMPFAPAEERQVLDTVRAAFSAPRKTLRNAVGKALSLDAAALAPVFERAAIDPAARAATLTVEACVRLARALDSAAAAKGRPGGKDRPAHA